MQGSKKWIVLDLMDFSGGSNSVEWPININANQVNPQTCGAILRKSGFLKYPGWQGLSSVDTFSSYLRLMTSYRDFNLSERLIALSNGTLSLVSTVDGSLTSLYSMGGATGEGWSCEAYGKLFVCNGTTNVKVESTVAYPVGIAAPTGVSAAASAGAGLPDGVYDIYASYARRVSSVDKLYSKGQYVGSVTLGTGNNRITISNFANSADTQVGNKVIWIKSPSEVVHYFFYGTNNNTTTSFIISGTGAKDTTNIYQVNSADNGLPPSGATFIYSFANRLWWIKDNIIYYSNKAYNEYDLEIVGASNFIISTHLLNGIFSDGEDLCFNSPDGILKLGAADPTSILYLIEPRWHFEYMRTVDRWNNGTIGLTNDGVRLFQDGKFTDYDISHYIKDVVKTAYSALTNFKPCGVVYRRDIRNEYHLCWNDQLVTTVNNQHWVLNLDSLSKGQDSTSDNFAWEKQFYSGTHFAVNRSTNALYIGQSHATAPRIAYESSGDDYSKYLYDSSGALVSTNTASQFLLVTREFMPDIAGRCTNLKGYVLYQTNESFEIQFFCGTEFSKKTPIKSIASAGAGNSNAKFDEATFDDSAFAGENPIVAKFFGSDTFHGKSIYAKITQNKHDPVFKLLALRIFLEVEYGNFN
jgi:hypothetical protein